MQMTDAQFKELIVYIAQQCGADERFGVTKLNKVLFFADFLYYLQNGQPLTGRKYVHDTFGPVPEGIETLRANMDKKDIAIAIMQDGEKTLKRVVALRDPDISSIPPDKIALLTQVISRYCGENPKSARWMTEFSHDFIGWDVTDMHEEIPYQTVYLKNKNKQVLSEVHIQHGRKLAALKGYGAAIA